MIEVKGKASMFDVTLHADGVEVDLRVGDRRVYFTTTPPINPVLWQSVGDLRMVLRDTNYTVLQPKGGGGK